MPVPGSYATRSAVCARLRVAFHGCLVAARICRCTPCGYVHAVVAPFTPRCCADTACRTRFCRAHTYTPLPPHTARTCHLRFRSTLDRGYCQLTPLVLYRFCYRALPAVHGSRVYITRGLPFHTTCGLRFCCTAVVLHSHTFGCYRTLHHFPTAACGSVYRILVRALVRLHAPPLPFTAAFTRTATTTRTRFLLVPAVAAFCRLVTPNLPTLPSATAFCC